jgi:Flp pilus assembly protein TadG
MIEPISLLARLRNLARALRREQRGNVLMIVGLAIIPLSFAVGMGIDYSRAMKLQTKLNAAADAAALAAVTKPMMSLSSATACATAKAMFVQQASGLKGLVLNTDDTTQLTITMADQGAAAVNCSSASLVNKFALARQATVTYRGQSQNAFAGLLGISTLTIKGTSQAISALAPNIDFYMMLDTSPSMLLPATSADLATMTSKTGGCAFACHQTSTSSSDPGGTSKKNGVYEDFYQVARDNKLTLRTDLVTEAVQALTDEATTTSQTNKAVYRMGLFDFDYMYRQIWPLLPIAGFNVDSSLSTVKTHVTDAAVLAYCNNNNRVCGVGDNDTATNFTTAFTGALASMPIKPGNGTNTAGDTPQAVLFIITDGMRDELSGGSRLMGPIPTSQCDTIKARKIRIAILYTAYLPESASDSWSQTNVKTPYLTPDDSKIANPLVTCATPGLYYRVTTDDDITAALSALFQKAVSTAHLTQ